MTTDVFASFSAFCEREGLSVETVRDLFRSDETSRDLLIGLETGTLPEAEFEQRFAEVLDIATSTVKYQRAKLPKDHKNNPT